MALVPVSEALARLLEGAAPLGIETVPLDAAQGRVLAEAVVARRTQPPFAASAMDGFAVRAEDTAKAPVRLRLIGQVAAGSVFDGTVQAGETVRIFTGAPVPHGADTVLIQEDAEPVGDDAVRAMASPAPGANVRPSGVDFGEGDLLLEPGRLLDAGALSLAAAGNHATLPVLRRPRVGLVATGDELVQPGETPGPGGIVASASVGIAAMLRDAGAETIDLGIARDTAASLEARLDAALEARCDLLVTLGGASVGDHDLVRPVFAARGMTLDFRKIAMRPGKPMMSGRLGALRVLGLPGNPVSAFVCAQLFAVPLVAALSGRRHVHRRRSARLEVALAGNGPRQHFMRATLARDAAGRLTARPFDNQDSSLIRVYAAADALVVRAPHAPALPAGAEVEAILLRDDPML